MTSGQGMACGEYEGEKRCQLCERGCEAPASRQAAGPPGFARSWLALVGAALFNLRVHRYAVRQDSFKRGRCGYDASKKIQKAQKAQAPQPVAGVQTLWAAWFKVPSKRWIMERNLAWLS